MNPEAARFTPRHALAIAFALVAIALLAPITVSAHGDSQLADAIVNLKPGEAVEFTGDLHYHRLVGRISADGPVRVTMVDSRSGVVAVERGPLDELRLNELIRCCDDRAWAPFALIVENAGDADISAAIDVRLAHDDLAIMVFGAESFTRESIAILGGIWAIVMWRAVRRKKASLSVARSSRLTTALIAVTAGITVYGAVQFGAGVVPSFLAGSSNIPLIPTNPIVSGTSLILAILGVTWALAGTWWARSSDSANRVAWISLGALLSALVAITAILIATTYGSVAVPVAAGIVAVLPLLVVLGTELRSSARSTLAR